MSDSKCWAGKHDYYYMDSCMVCIQCIDEDKVERDRLISEVSTLKVENEELKEQLEYSYDCNMRNEGGYKAERDQLLAENSRTTYLIHFKRIAELEARVEELKEYQDETWQDMGRDSDRYRKALEEIINGRWTLQQLAVIPVAERLRSIATTALAPSNPSEVGDTGVKCACGGSKYYSKSHPTNPDYVDRLYRCDCGGE